jgi:hypothetical protein
LAALCDARHIKKSRVNRAKLQQATAKLLSKDDARRIAVNIAKKAKIYAVAQGNPA